MAEKAPDFTKVATTTMSLSEGGAFGLSHAEALQPVLVKRAQTLGSREPTAPVTLPVGQVVQGLHGLSDAELRDLQRQLLAGGYYSDSYYGRSPKSVRLGQPDVDTEAAYARAVGEAARSGLTPDETLARAVRTSAQLPAGAGVTGGQTDTHVNALDDPATIRQALRASFGSKLGFRPTDAELNRFVASIRGEETKGNAAVFSAQDRAAAAYQTAVTGQAAAFPVDTQVGHGIDGKPLAPNLQAFLNAAGGRITVSSGYRTLAEQTALFNNSDKTGHTVARPGHSNHEKGLAADLHFADDKARQWAHEHAAEFGLTFPMSYEPWHIELSGARDATPGGGVPATPAVLPISQTVTRENVDVGARAEELALQLHPADADAQRFGEVYSWIEQLTSAGRQ